MITLLASLGGFISSIFPELFKIWRDSSDRKHELAIMQLQMQVAAQQETNKLDELGIYANISESAALYRTYKTGISWVDALNGTVRPVITYAFFFLYAAVKYIQYHIIGDEAPLFQYLDVLWGQEDQAILASTISFYFGQRAINKRLSK